MRIEHSVTISAGVETVWNIFTDLTCWKDWNSVTSNVVCDTDTLTQGKAFKFCIRPFAYPIYIQPLVEEVVPLDHIIWSGSSHGIFARHEFLFREQDGRTILTSRETFRLSVLKRLFFRIPRSRLHALSVQMLDELKKAAEQTGPTNREEDAVWQKKHS